MLLETKLSVVPVVMLTNGVRVVNFSSGHPFTFDDGTILAACQDDRVKTLALNRADIETPNPGGWIDVQPVFRPSPEVLDEIQRLCEDEEIDVILIPLPVMSALKDAGMKIHKCRTIIRANRETTSGPGLIRSDKFGI